MGGTGAELLPGDVASCGQIWRVKGGKAIQLGGDRDHQHRTGMHWNGAGAGLEAL